MSAAATSLTDESAEPERPAFAPIVPGVSLDALFIKVGALVVFGYGAWVVVSAIIESW